MSPLKVRVPRGTLAAPRKSEIRRKSHPNLKFCAARHQVTLSLTSCRLFVSNPLPPSASANPENELTVTDGTPTSRGVSGRLPSLATLKAPSPSAPRSKPELARGLSVSSFERL